MAMAASRGRSIALCALLATTSALACLWYGGTGPHALFARGEMEDSGMCGEFGRTARECVGTLRTEAWAPGTGRNATACEAWCTATFRQGCCSFSTTGGCTYWDGVPLPASRGRGSSRATLLCDVDLAVLQGDVPPSALGVVGILGGGAPVCTPAGACTTCGACCKTYLESPDACAQCAAAECGRPPACWPKDKCVCEACCKQKLADAGACEECVSKSCGQGQGGSSSDSGQDNEDDSKKKKKKSNCTWKCRSNFVGIPRCGWQCGGKL